MSRTGEFERIQLFLQAFRSVGGATTGSAVPLGPGDDAAILLAPKPLAITTDALVEDVHFKRGWGTWEQVGWKALAVNLSDIAAMGARPTAFTCAIGHPPGFEEDDLTALAQGMGRLASVHGAVLAGGNFSRAREVSITITALGQQERNVLRRDSAKVGDRLILIGDIGVAAAELRWLMTDRKLPEGRSALLQPTPQLEAGQAAAVHAHCGIDVSDGLAQDLGHIADASQVKVRLDYTRIPVSARFQQLTSDCSDVQRAQMLLAGGEDYALVIAAPESVARDLCRDLQGVEIGSIEEGRGVEITNTPQGVSLVGHDHFRSKN